MEQRRMITSVRFLCSLAVLLAALGTARAGGPEGKAEAPKHLPEKVVRAWKEAGAEGVWLRAEKLDFSAGLFVHCAGYFWFVPEKKGKPGDLPAFYIKAPQPGCLAKLPVPATAFGLDLRGTKEMDERLKELTRFTSLQTLELFGAEVTGAGLKELRGLKNLRDLSLQLAKVTDVSLKELG